MLGVARHRLDSGADSPQRRARCSGIGPATPIAALAPAEDGEEGRDAADCGTHEHDGAAEQLEAKLPEQVAEQAPTQSPEQDAPPPQQEHPDDPHAAPPFPPIMALRDACPPLPPPLFLAEGT